MSEFDPNRGPVVQIPVYLDAATLARVEALALRIPAREPPATSSEMLGAVVVLGLDIAEINEERLPYTPGRPWTRSQTANLLLQIGLAAAEINPERLDPYRNREPPE